MSPFDAPRVKAAVRSLTMEHARQVAAECLTLYSAAEIRAHLRKSLDACLPRFLLGEAENGEELESSPPAPDAGEAEGD